MSAQKPQKKVRFAPGYVSIKTPLTVEVVEYTGRRSKRVTEDEFQDKNQNHLFMLKYLCIVGTAFFVLLAVYMIIRSIYVSSPSQSCQCLLKQNVSQSHDTISIINTYNEVECTAEGSNSCKAICTSLATTIPRLFEEMICMEKKNTDNFKGSLYFQACPGNVWKPADFHMAVCCTNGINIKCNPVQSF